MVIAGFGGVVSGIEGRYHGRGNADRVLTAAISMEVSKGSFELATALSVILLFLSLANTAALTQLQQQRSLLAVKAGNLQLLKDKTRKRSSPSIALLWMKER